MSLKPCRRSAGRHSRHSAANDVIFRALRSAGVPSIKEPAGCSRTDGKRPDGLTLVPWMRGRSLVWDFTCTDTYAPSNLLTTSSRSGAAAELAEKSKKAKYAFLEGRYFFVPIAVETSGVWGKDGMKFVKDVGQRLQIVSGEPRSKAFLVQRISIAVQKGNVASILGTLPHGKELDEIFY